MQKSCYSKTYGAIGATFPVKPMKQTAESEVMPSAPGPTPGLSVESPPRQCACGGVCRAGQRNCLRCHALANRIYRARVKHSAELLEKLFFRLLAVRISVANSPEQR